MENGTEDDKVDMQRKYYADTAGKYDSMHCCERDEHYFALRFLETIVDYYEVKSILDIGAGTGRAALHLKSRFPHLTVLSIEPVRELREIGHSKGLSEAELIEGDATNLTFADGEFDLVCEFAVLHHIAKPERAVSEMLRVARVGIFISDSNNFGQGSFPVRTLKQALDFFGLWKAADFVKTKGKGYLISDGDGLSYSYSVFNNYNMIAQSCANVHILNTNGGGINPYRTASHVALLGIKAP